MGKTIIKGNFEWDEEKNEANIAKHGISFDEILPMFDDPLFWEDVDVEHSTTKETRYVGMALVKGISVVFSSYTERKRIRIISARKASAIERRRYYEKLRRFYS